MLPRYTGAGKSNGRLSSPFFKSPRMYKLNDLTVSGTKILNDEMFPRNSQGEE